MAEGLVARTCDACAESKTDCLPEGDANICGDCRAFHGRALDAAARAIMESNGWTGFNAETVAIMWDRARTDAAAAVKAYCEFTDD